MSFQPSRHSYGWWSIDDAKAAVTSRYEAAVSAVTSARDDAIDTALAPARAARDAAADVADRAERIAADAKAASEATRDTAASVSGWVPWLVGGAVVLGGLYMATQHGGRRGNPLDGHTAARWLLLGGTIAGGTGALLTTAGAATLQPEVLVLSAPLMVVGAALVASAGAAEKFHSTRDGA